MNKMNGYYFIFWTFMSKIGAYFCKNLLHDVISKYYFYLK